jgi:acyl-CoA thioester hydrolase
MNAPQMQGAVTHEGEVLPEWIDVNDHMNVAYYVLAFDYGVDSLWEQFGITEDYMDTARCSTFAVESHIFYVKELLEGDPYIVTAQILACDEKRIHQFQRIYHAEKKYLAATAEWMNLHVNLETRRVCPWPDDILARIMDFAQGQTDQSWPEAAGKRMEVRQPLYSRRSES